MLGKSFAVLASAALALASPFLRDVHGSSHKHERPAPQLPVNGGSSELPDPPPSESLKHTALGFGIQNYSCTDAGAGPVAAGALAVLYDVTNLYPGQSHSSLAVKDWASLPSDVLNTEQVPLNRNEDGGASVGNPFPKKQSLKVKDVCRSLPYLGRHFFNDVGVLTAGGLSHGCKIKGTDSTSYTALYWFYG